MDNTRKDKEEFKNENSKEEPGFIDEDEEVMSKEEEAKIRDRLKQLGYL